MKAYERRIQLLDSLKNGHPVEVPDIAGKFGVSEMTIRRDLRLLERQGLLVKTHGGVIPLENSSIELSFVTKGDLHIHEKRRIAQEAVKLVQGAKTIILDSGTTTGEIARALGARSDLCLTVITNALNIANMLHSCRHLSLILLGGAFRETSMAFMGPLAEDALAHINADIGFIGVDGVDLDKGSTVPDATDARLKQRIIASSKVSVVVADHTKLGVTCLATICPLSGTSSIITGREATSAFVAHAKIRGLNVILA